MPRKLVNVEKYSAILPSRFIIFTTIAKSLFETLGYFFFQILDMKDGGNNRTLCEHYLVEVIIYMNSAH